MQERGNFFFFFLCVCLREIKRERVEGERDPLIFKGIRIVDLTDKKFFLNCERKYFLQNYQFLKTKKKFSFVKWFMNIEYAYFRCCDQWKFKITNPEVFPNHRVDYYLLFLWICVSFKILETEPSIETVVWFGDP